MQKEKKIRNQFIAAALMVFLILNTGIAQPVKSPLIEKDEKVSEAMKKGNIEKGMISYDVMQNVMQNNFAKQVKFEVSVESEQQVIVEIFNENAELIEVIYNDFMLPNEMTKFWLSGKKWDDELTYYLRVTSDDKIENHAIVFSDY